MLINCLLHVHSSFSYDSKTDLAEIARIARAQRIDCVLMSEHNNFMNTEAVSALVARCDELSDESLLIIPGLELAYDSNRVHLLAYGVRRYIDSVAPGTTFRSLIDAVHDAHGLAVLAHPSHRDAARLLEEDDLQALDGIEVWNVKNGNRFFPTAPDLLLYQALRSRASRPLHAFAGLDWHSPNRFLRIVLTAQATARTAPAVLHALKHGRFTIHCGAVDIPSNGDISQWRRGVYGIAGGGLSWARKTGHRWQARLERSGFKTPRFVASVARRLF